MKASQSEKIEQQIVDMIKTCYDPEIPVDIYELGLIYDIQIDADKVAHVKMTLTSPNCPVAGSLPGEVEEKIRSIEELSDAKVEVIWDPPWSQDMMSEEAKLELGLF